MNYMCINENENTTWIWVKHNPKYLRMLCNFSFEINMNLPPIPDHNNIIDCDILWFPIHPNIILVHIKMIGLNGRRRGSKALLKWCAQRINGFCDVLRIPFSRNICYSTTYIHSNKHERQVNCSARIYPSMLWIPWFYLHSYTQSCTSYKNFSSFSCATCSARLSCKVCYFAGTIWISAQC